MKVIKMVTFRIFTLSLPLEIRGVSRTGPLNFEGGGGKKWRAEIWSNFKEGKSVDFGERIGESFSEGVVRIGAEKFYRF